ncbi:hypothetical protein ACH5RR_009115 [Cinchona calisaya]|uniref:Endonuclease/exonuclease/phosphatase domain-containing protein n=1 Tax=Cinchona calisaya TaxID=153742 RepID=A0ABD3AF71_9GENT
MAHCTPGWQYLHNAQSSGVSRIIVCWNDAILEVGCLDCYSQAISCNVRIKETQTTCFVTFVYGSNDDDERKALRDHLLALQRTVSNQPWLLIGDFNIIRSCKEKIGGKGFKFAAMDFNNYLESLDVEDIPAQGFFFTRCNQKEYGSRIYSKLDRMLMNGAWFQHCSYLEAEFVNPGISDHSLAIMRLKNSFNTGPKPFKFNQFLMKHPSYPDLLASKWNEVVTGDPMFCLCMKLKNLKGNLRTLNKKHFSSISLRVRQAKDNLCQTQLLL